jgi:hypothetical protein
MALTLVAAPGSTDLSKNQITASITTNRYVVQAATAASITLNVASTAASVGQIITFIVAGNAYPFTFATGLGDTGDVVRTAGALSLTAFIAQVADDFGSDQFIYSNYTITYTTSRITLTAKQPGAAWSINATMNASGFSLHAVTAGVDWVVQPNFYINLDLYVEKTLGSGVFEKMPTQAQQPTALNNRIDFSLEEFLHAVFDRCDLPTFNQNTVTLCIHNRRKYYITYYESFGDPSIVKLRNYISPVYTVFRGGTTRQEAAIFQNVITSWVHQTKQFLTWQPNNKVVRPYEYDWLYFCAPSGLTSFRIRYHIYYFDTTTATGTISTRSSVNQFDTFLIPAGFTQLNLAAINPSKTVVWYEVFLDDGSPANEVSLRRRFYLETSTPLGFLQFIFSNTLSAMDVMTCTGNIIQSIDPELTLSNRPYERTSVLTTGEQFQTDPQKLLPTKVNTGPLTLAQTKWIESLLLSEYKYVIDPVMEQHVPIYITPASVVKTDLTSDLWNVEFEFTLAFFDHSGSGGIRQTLQSGN